MGDVKADGARRKAFGDEDAPFDRVAEPINSADHPEMIALNCENAEQSAVHQLTLLLR